jgi:hypothetical protein
MKKSEDKWLENMKKQAPEIDKSENEFFQWLDSQKVKPEWWMGPTTFREFLVWIYGGCFWILMSLLTGVLHR